MQSSVDTSFHIWFNCSLLKSLFQLLLVKLPTLPHTAATLSRASVPVCIGHWRPLYPDGFCPEVTKRAALGNSYTVFIAETTLTGAPILKAATCKCNVTLPVAWVQENRIRPQAFRVPVWGNPSAFRDTKLRTSSLTS